MKTGFPILCLFYILSCSSSILKDLDSIQLDEKSIVTSFYRLETIYKKIKVLSELMDFNGFVRNNYLPQLRSYIQMNSEIFLTEAINSGIVFQIFVSFFDNGSKEPEFFFRGIREKCMILKNPLKAETEKGKQEISKDTNAKLSDITKKARGFAERRIYVLLRKSSTEWNQSKKIISLLIRFLSTIKSFVFPFEGAEFCSTSLSIDIERYEFIVEQFSEFIKSENQVGELAKLYIELKSLPTPEKFQGKPDFNDCFNVVGRKLFLFSLFSSFILSSKTFKLEDLPGLTTELLALGVVASNQLLSVSYALIADLYSFKKNIPIHHKEFNETETKLIDSAFDILHNEILIDYHNGPSNSKRAEIYVENPGDTSSKSYIDSLRKYVEGAFDLNFDESFDISRLKFQAYIHFSLKRKSKC
jgi:hypothetical protein